MVWTQLKECDKSERWKHVLINELKKINPFCCFVFKKKWTKKDQSQKKSPPTQFSFKGECKFSDCDVHFSVVGIIEGGFRKSIEISMVPCTVKHHLRERHARPHITGKQRESLGREMKNSAPSSVRSKKIQGLDDSQLQSGCRDGIGCTVEVFRKTSSEAKTEFKADKHLIPSLMALKDEFLSVQPCIGFVQKITAYPFSVVLFSEIGIRLYHSMSTIVQPSSVMPQAL